MKHLRNTQVFSHLWVTLPWQLRWDEHSGRHHLCYLASGGWHSSVTSPELLMGGSVGGLVKVKTGRKKGWRDRKMGRVREKVKMEIRLIGPLGPYDALMTDASAALRWNWSGCSVMARSHPSGGEEYTMQQWRTFAGVIVFVLDTHCLYSCLRKQLLKRNFKNPQ